MKRILLLLALCACVIFFNGCDFKTAAQALKKTMETVNKDSETTTPPTTGGDVNISPVSLTDAIRGENKTITGDKKQWIDLYKQKLYPNSYNEIAEITSTPVAEFTYMSDEFTVAVTEFNVAFSNEIMDTLIVIDVNSESLVDIINKKSMPEVYDHYYIFDILKADSRFSDKLADSIGNKIPDNAAEFDLTTLTQLGNGYHISSVKAVTNTLLEIVYDDGTNTAAFELDYRASVMKSLENGSSDNNETPPAITSINSEDGKHNAYIDDTTGNLYVRDTATGDVWLIYEAAASPKEAPAINYVYKTKLIYSVFSIDSVKGFGIYDFKSNSNTIYLDDVDIHGIQNGILFLNGSSRIPANPSFTMNLNTDDYKLTDISGMFSHNIYLAENGTYYASVNSYTGETRVTVYNTSDNKIRGEYVFDFVSSRIFDIILTGNNLILICPGTSLGHDYIYTIALS